jgi:hypothetical protein
MQTRLFGPRPSMRKVNDYPVLAHALLEEGAQVSSVCSTVLSPSAA